MSANAMAHIVPRSTGDDRLDSTGERFIPGLGGAIELEHVHRYMFARQVCAGRDVLDIACGEGYGSAMLAQSARTVVGVDIADEAVAHAKKRYSASQVRFEVGSCAAIPLPDAAVDVVVSFETIEHHDEHEAMMREIRRVLRPGGVLVLSSPERFEYSERPGTHNEFHVHELYRDEFVALVREHFTHADLYDQKVLFGSAILPEERATHTTSAHAGALHLQSRGLVRPLYLIAVASDGPLPSMDTGVFEQDLAETSEWKWWIATVGDRDERIRALSAETDSLTAEVSRARARVEEAAGALARVQELEASLAQSVTERDAVLRGHADVVGELARLQMRFISTHEALDARTAELSAEFTARTAELRQSFDVERRAAALERAAAERAAAEAATAHGETLRRQAAERESALASTFAAREAELAAAFAARETAFAAAFAERESTQIEKSLTATRALESRIEVDRTALAHLQQRLADLAADHARKIQQHDEVVVWARSVDAALAERSEVLVSTRRDLATAHAELDQLHHYAAKLAWVLSTTRHATETAAARSALLERALADAVAARDALQGSTSWRVTRPLRLLKDGLLALRRSTRRGASRALRGSYRRLPPGMKTNVKDTVFGTFRFALGNTGAYRDWELFNRRGPDHATAAAEAEEILEAAAPTALQNSNDDASDDATTAAEPIEQLGEHTTVMTEPVTTAPTYSAAGMPLWVADGVAEWAELQPTRERIAAVAAARRGMVVPEPAVLERVGDDEVEAAADRLAFGAVAEPVVTILIPVFNKIAMTLECLTSIAHAKSSIPFEILVADDASTDRTSAVLARIANIQVHRNAQNLHFLRNCNAALPLAAGRYVVFLNNDVQVKDWWLDEMIAVFEGHDRVGAVGPKIVYPDGHLQEAGCAFDVDMTVDMVGLHDDPSLPGYNYARRVDYCSGACLLVSTALLDTLGGFDEAFAPAYCEDGDLCMRIREQGLFVYYAPRATVVHRLSATTAAEGLDDKRRLVAANLATFAARWQDAVANAADVRAIAFYLPQYYPFPENDRWWGKGFTEWTNVTKAQPNFIGHYQPHLPADLGFYDLRVAHTMEDQARLARRYGLGGFCFYYYWFAGKRLLDLPLERMLESGRPDFPFCLCWANENWTRRWDGQETNILMAQSHSDADDEAVILDLMRYFRSPNYIRIDGRPLLVIYRVTLFPDFARTAAHWRSVCRDRGIGDIYIAMVESFELVGSSFHPSTYGCDATIEFPPQGLAEVVPASGPLINPDFVGHCVDYRTLALRYCSRPAPAYTRFRGAMPGWDNTPRRQNNSYCVEHSSPGAFQAWMEHIVDDARRQHFGDERIVFVNAWNEWAEGAHLEPDRRFGHAYLEALANAKDHRALLTRQRYAFDG